MRKYYIDNLRNMTILLLFPVHTFMIWNNFGSGFYIWQEENRLLSTCIVLVNPWFMPILFVLAGMSARYALEIRTPSQFIRQRVCKLLLPFIAGIIVLVPFQTLYARKYFDGYRGDFFDNWRYFFSHLTDFSGYDGAFTPGHLWFLAFLFLISMLALILFHFVPYERIVSWVEKVSAVGIFFFFVPIWLMYYIGNYNGYSFGKDFALYLVGYYVLSNETVIERLGTSIRWLAGLCLIAAVSLAMLYYNFSYYGDFLVNVMGWNTILVLLVFGKRFLNKKTRFTEFFNETSYSIYLLHQSVLVALAYYIVRTGGRTVVQAVKIGVFSFLLSALGAQFISIITKRLTAFRRQKSIYREE